jgi:hypothetical protein
MSTIPFPKIMAWPCNLDNTTLLDILSEHQCAGRIKEEFVQHIESWFLLHRRPYPKESKEFYLVPFSHYREASELGIRPAKFAMLWLPSVAAKITKIRELVSEELKEMPIVAWEKGFSCLKGGRFLYFDPGLGEVLFNFAKPEDHFDFPRNWQYIGELQETVSM